MTHPVFVVRCVLSILVTLSSFFAFAQISSAEGTVRGSLKALRVTPHGQAFFLSIKTPLGLEQFVLRHDSATPGAQRAVHLRGASRPRKGRGSNSLVAATRIGQRIILFYTSSRRGIPSSVSFTLVEQDGETRVAGLRFSKAAATSLPCASGRSHEVAHSLNQAEGVQQSAFTAETGTTPFNPPRVLEISTRADYDFYLQYGASVNESIAAYLHAAEVFYTGPLGIRFKIVDQTYISSGPPAGAAQIDAALLLEAYRRQMVAERGTADVFHLFTGVQLVGRTIGIAYVKSACSGSRSRYNVGLSRSISAALMPILVGHEIAHNLGASHDGEINSIMSPVISATNDHFSGTALSSMKSAISRSMACITRAPVHEVSLVPVDISSGTTLNATINAASNDVQECTASLFAQPYSKGRPAGPFYRLKDLQIFTTPGYTPYSFSYVASLPPYPAEASEVLFQMKMWCGSRAYVTNPQLLSLPAGGSASSLTAGSREWVQALRANFQQQ